VIVESLSADVAAPHAFVPARRLPGPLPAHLGPLCLRPLGPLLPVSALFEAPIEWAAMKPEVHLLGISVKTFGVTFALGFLACGLVIARRLRELRLPVDWAYELVFAALIGGVVGARGYFLLQNYHELKGSLLKNAFSGSGLIWYGGAVGGAIAVLAWMHWRKALNLVMIDMCVTVLALGYAIGRIGCQVSGDGDYGIRSKLPWAMGYPHGTVPTPAGVTVQPTPIYETVAMGLVAYLLWQLRDRVRPGVVLGLYLVLSGGERLLVEFIRRNKEVLVGLTAAQLESIVSMVLGAIVLAVIARRGGWAKPGSGADAARGRDVLAARAQPA
jgi:phosphatidylglycerol---prolipoprotein diacylglyceryl transferase